MRSRFDQVLALFTVIAITLVIALPTSLAGCGHVKAVEGGVHVDTSNCREARPTADQSVDKTVLDCVSGGDVNVRIELQRTAWQAIQGLDAAPPLAAANAPSLSIDGTRCREDANDKPSSEQALLSCEGISDGGKTSFLVSIGRHEWKSIKSRTRPGPVDPGPGK